MEVRFVKLISGDEFIAEPSKEGFINAIKLMQAQEGMAIVPFPMLRHKDDVLKIKEEHIMFYTSVPPEIEDEYKKQFGGIITPKKSLIGV